MTTLTPGLAPGLTDVLAGLDIAATAPRGVAVLPVAEVPDGAPIVPNNLAAREGLALVRIPGADEPGPPRWPRFG